MPSPPTIIREFNHTYQQPDIVRNAEQKVVNTISTISRAPIIERREAGQSRSRSGSKISFNYISPAKPVMVQSILVPDQSSPRTVINQSHLALSSSKVGQQQSSPYKLLESSFKAVEEAPKIIVTQPPPPSSSLKDEPLSESLFSFEQEDSKMLESKRRRKIFPPKEGQTAHFIEVN